MFFFSLFLLVKQTENINFLCLNFSMRTCQYFARGTLHPSCRSMRTCCRLSPWGLEEKLWPAWLMLVTWLWQPSPKGSCMVIGVSHKFSANLFSNLKFKFIFLVINGGFFFFFCFKVLMNSFFVQGIVQRWCDGAWTKAMCCCKRNADNGMKKTFCFDVEVDEC